MLPFFVNGQYDIAVENKEIVNFCEPISYFLDIEKLFNTTLNNLELEVTFSEDIIYLSNGLGLSPINVDTRRIVFDYPDLLNCNLQTGDIIIQPVCNDVLTTLQTSFTLKTAFVCLSESEQRVIIKTPIIDVQFSDYTYEPSSGQLKKSLHIINAGSVDIEQLYVLPIADQQFAVLESTSVGQVVGDTILFNQASLRSKDSLLVDLVFSLDNCDLRSIRYEVGFICEATSCATKQLFIDENNVYTNDVSAEILGTDYLFSNAIDYGLCEPFSTIVSIKNLEGFQKTSIADIYNLKYSVLPMATFKRRFEECMQLSGEINGLPVTLNKVSVDEYVFEFQSVTSDPDGLGGLEDLDGDGAYDDMALGDSTSFNLQLILKEDCYDNYQSLETAFDVELRFNNFCDLELNRHSQPSEEEFNRGNTVANYFRGTVARIDALQINQSNKRFLIEGDRLLFKYNLRPSANMSRICETDELVLTIDVPPTVEWDSSTDIIYVDNNDTIVLQPEIVDDSLYQFSFVELDSVQSSLEMSFIAVCDLNNTNYDAAMPVCEQCIEYGLPRFGTQLSKACDIACDVPIPAWESVSAPFYTKCASLPELIEPLRLGQIEYFNLSSGFLDPAELTKRDPMGQASSVNNRFYFDGDTILIRIPFDFECAEELKEFTIQLTENQLSFYEFNVFSSDIILLNSTGEEENRCPANLFLNQSETALSFSFSESSFSLPCLDGDKEHVIEMKIKFTYDCELNSNCGLLAQGVLQGVTRVQLRNDCVKQVSYKKDTVYIHEVFKEEFFRPVDFLFGPQTAEIFDQYFIRTPLYRGLFDRRIELDAEYKRRPIQRSINYTVPQGFEVISDFMIASSDLLFLNVNAQFQRDIDKVDTLVRSPLSSMVNADGSRTYSFTDLDTKYYSGQLEDAITAGITIKSVCDPERNNQSIEVDGVIEYVDYANGSLDTISFPFLDIIPLQFKPELFIVEDDFQIIESTSSGVWRINKQVDLFSFDSFVSEDDRVTDEFKYYIKYKSKQLRIDSITALPEYDQLSAMNSPEFKPFITSFIGDSIIELEIAPRILTQNDGDVVYNTLKPTQFMFHTSNHSCGFDTLFFEIARKAQFLKDTCSQMIFNDFFSTYSPPGFPQLEWIDLPQDIKTYESNQLAFTLSNIGQGDLIDNRIIFENIPVANYTLFLVDKNGNLEDISNALMTTNNVEIDLSTINNSVLSGLTNLDLSSLEFVLELSEVCVSDKLFNIKAKALSQSYCGDEQISTILYSGPLPFVAEENLAFRMSLASFTERQCLDTAIVRIIIETDSPQDLENPELHIVLPKDLDSYSGTLQVNGLLVPDPDTKLDNDGRHYLFIVTQGLPTTISESLVIDFKLDGSCIDVCREDVVNAYLFSNVNQQCVDANSANPLVTRAYQANQDLRWKPNLSVSNMATKIIGTKEDLIEFELLSDIELSETPMYGGDVSITVFGDLNQNTILDPTDVIINQETIAGHDFKNQVYSLADTLLIEPSMICALHLIVDVDESCSCLFTSIPISQAGVYETTREIQNCGSDQVNISVINVQDCQQRFSDDSRISPADNGRIVFQTDLSKAVDTLRVFTDCPACQFIEEFVIRNEQSTVEIQLIPSEDCSSTAQVLWNEEEEIPDDLQIEWNIDNQQTPIIYNIPAGLLRVELMNDVGCVYWDTLTISQAVEFNYEIVSDDPICSSDFPAILDIIPEGTEPITILWDDGSTSFQRMDVMPGQYQFTITDGSACMKIDSVNFAMPADNMVQSIVNNPDCLSPTSGSIELQSSGQSLSYSLEKQDFSVENIFTNVSSGEYVIYIQNEQGCIDSIAVDVLIDTNFIVPIPLTRQSAFGATLSLNPDLVEHEQFIWRWESADFELSCQTCANPQIQVDKEGEVFLSVSTGSCTYNGNIQISAEFSDLVYIPDAINTSSTLANDKFFIYPNASFDEIDLIIYDRWGNEMYRAEQVNPLETEKAWDGTLNGKEADIGVYVYKAVIRRFADEMEIELLGDFLLINN